MIERHRVLLIGDSSHVGKSYLGKLMSAYLGIDKFLERICTYNDWIVSEVERLGLVSLDVESMSNVDEVLGRCLSAFENQEAMRR